MTKWEYKRVLFNAEETINKHEKLKDKRFNRYGRVVNNNAEDSVETILNIMGDQGWELASTVNLDSGSDGMDAPVINVIEYIFRRMKVDSKSF